MSILIKQAKIVDSKSPLNGKVMDVLIEGGKIVEIKKTITANGNERLIQANGLHLSIGWIDMQATCGNPGYEFKEDFDSLIKCAASGGFTGVCLHSNNQPQFQNKAQIEYILNSTKNKVCNVYPIGAITNECKGKEMAEMFDMKQSGALAFSDYKHPIKDAGTLLRAIQYSTNINAFVIAHCNDESISHGGQMNEGEVSTRIGLKGMPALAEELMLERNISILEYTGGKLHIPTISTKGSCELIKKAKAKGLQITCGVAAINLLLDDSELESFDTNVKLNPPLRTKKDVISLRNAVESGVIDVIVSDHQAQDTESKELEFDLADDGALGVQTAFNCSFEALKDKNIETLIDALTHKPREILKLEQNQIEEKQVANLTLFSISESFTFTEKNNYSKSKNSPFFGRTFNSKVIGIINGGKSWFN